MSTPAPPSVPRDPVPGDPSVIVPSPSPMDPLVVLVVGVLLHGVAYFLYGQWKKGVASLLAYVAIFVIGLVTCGAGFWLYTPAWVLIFIDAYMQAKNLKDGRAIREWTWFSQVA